MAALKFDITDENIDDILCTALEGGINYWCGKAEVKDGDYNGAEYASSSVSKGSTIILHDAEGIESSVEIDKEKVCKGIEKYVNKYGSEIIDLDTKDIDCCQVDALIADMIVQLAAFDEIIYG